MSEPITASEARQILDGIQSMQGDIRAMQSDIQALTLEVRTNQATTNEKFNTVQAEINAVRTELKGEIKAVDDKLSAKIQAIDDKVTDLSDRQKVVDSRLWAFIVGLVTLVGGGVIKVFWFSRA
ncbi:hemagglutinin [Candidatus Synechococcus calcipolaris G9]|uniref:Hemagglutinin n=1 Tax=Candidatus Synechococcus calcipolaris G9 TaxID=1497997 RepID=A0ABT6F2R1_9SYNE|nr:hemagglutinin [Candidatus Synechococcus calcipolaris]MDG2992117.1 hemagglutinin [Candidatus Synechococcus calcipolaris G9]